MIGEKCRMWGQRQKGRGRKLCDKFGLLVAQPPLPGHYLYPTDIWGSRETARGTFASGMQRMESGFRGVLGLCP